MTKEINTLKMYREVAILCFGNKYYISMKDHQHALIEALEDNNMNIDNIDTEELDYCKNLEKQNGMCAIDLYVDDNRESYILIQSIEYLKDANLDLIEEIWDFELNGQGYIGFEEGYTSDIAIFTDNFEEFKTIIQNKLKEVA